MRHKNCERAGSRCLSNTSFASDKDPLETFLRQNVHQRWLKLEVVFCIVKLVRHFLKKRDAIETFFLSFRLKKGLDQHFTPTLKLFLKKFFFGVS